MIIRLIKMKIIYPAFNRSSSLSINSFIIFSAFVLLRPARLNIASFFFERSPNLILKIISKALAIELIFAGFPSGSNKLLERKKENTTSKKPIRPSSPDLETRNPDLNIGSDFMNCSGCRIFSINSFISESTKARAFCR